MRTAMLAFTACSLLLSSAFADGQAPKGKTEYAREIDLPGYRGERNRGDVRKPTRITNADELAKAIPDKEWQDCIAKQVDFTREYLLLFAWAGSGQDKLSFKVGGRGIVPAVEFLYTMGRTDDLRSHFHLFAVKGRLTWNVRQVAHVREIKGVRFTRQVEGGPTEITTAEQLAKVFGETGAGWLRDEVDFAREKLVWVTWSGSSSESLTYRIESRGGKMTVVLAIHSPNPSLTDYRPHGILLVLPRDAAWEFGNRRPI
jgi:hypothetical protein